MNQGTQTAAEQAAGMSEQPAETAPVQKSGGISASVQSLAATLVIAIFVITFVIQAFQIPSESMENTLLIGDYLLVDKVHYAPGGNWGKVEPYGDIRRGDIIVFRYPVNPTQHFVKRVIGVPGDRIRLINKRVYVNGTPTRENYAVYRDKVLDDYRDDFPSTEFPSVVTPDSMKWWSQMRQLTHNGELIVPAKQYFVLGDNRDQSLDSRYWGFVPRENVIGRPLVIYWSLRHADSLAPVAAAETETVSDKVVHFTYILSHLWQETRWNRTLRLIK
jgi:signal peptidase I